MVQTGLDHIIVGINDLDQGVAWVEQRTGVRAAYGGVHPGRGTRNALLSLGADCYLEIIAPDPGQSAPTWFPQVLAMPEPRLIAWAVHTSNLAALAQIALAAGLAIDGPHDGARSRPDGEMLSWKLFHLRDDRGGLLPFFIEWGLDSQHPSADAPPGCTLEHFQLQSPDAPGLKQACQSLAVEIVVKAAGTSSMQVRIASPKGGFDLTS